MVLLQTGCGGGVSGEDAARQAEAGSDAGTESGADVVEAGGDALPDAWHDAAGGGVDAPAETGTTADGGDAAGEPGDGGGADGGDDGALAACITHACDYANPGQGGANCGVLPGVTCGGQPVNCSAWQGAPDGGCSSVLPPDYVCGGSGVANSCGNNCESTATYQNACSDAYLPSAWAVVQACNMASAGPVNPVPYAISGGVVTWRSQPVTVGCSMYTCRYCNPPVALFCCN